MLYTPDPKERPATVTDLTVPVESHPKDTGGMVTFIRAVTAGRHCPTLVAPDETMVHVPLGHAVHAFAVPAAAAYDPAGHSVQPVLPAVENDPEGHTLLVHALEFTAPADAENVPPGHRVQFPAPGCSGHVVVTVSG